MTATEIPVNNGVNVEALLGVRDALPGTPEIAQFQWRSTVSWVNGTHSRSDVETFYGFGDEQQHHTTFSYDVDHPLQFAAQDNGVTPVEYVLVALGGCLTAGVAAVASKGRSSSGRCGPPLPRRWTCTGFSAPTRMYAMASAVSLSATRSTPTPRPRRSGRWSRSRRSGPPSTTSSPTRPASPSTFPDPVRVSRRLRRAEHHHCDHRGRPLRAGYESLPGRSFGRSCRPRTRRGGELLAHAAVGLAAPAHPELDDPAARLRLPRRRPGRQPQSTAGRRDARGLRRRIHGAGTDRHDGDLGAGRRRRIRGADRPGQLARADGGAGLRGSDRARGAGAGAAGAGRNHLRHPGGLP